MAVNVANARVEERRDLGAGAAARLSDWLKGYQTVRGIPDELFDAMRRPREHWLCLLGDFAEYSPSEARSRFALASRHIRDTGVSYRIYGEETERAWPLNPLPLVLSEGEWRSIEAGVAQRARLMEAILRDLYGDAALITEGALPAAVVTGSSDFIRAMRGVRAPGGRHLQIYAVDLARGPDGRWWVLDDRTQAPSGAGYALENRLVLSRAYPGLYNSMNVERLAPFFNTLRQGLASVSARADPRLCLLTPGPYSESYFEQAHLARYLGLLLVEGADLVANDGKVYVRTIAGLKRADVLLRRVDADYVDPLELNAGSRLGTPGLVDAIRQGGVSVLNMPGSGVLESKALLGFLPALSRRLLGEDLAMPNVATWWCGQPAEQAFVEANMDRLAVAPAFAGSDPRLRGPTLLSDLSSEDRRAFLANFADRPCDFVGQEVVRLSTTPVLRDGGLTPAPFVLRVYATATSEGFHVMPGGFCRTSDRLDVRAISMGDDVRTADVWVIADQPVERVTRLVSSDDVKVQRIVGWLPSRAADNLFWLGRYLERAEATLRLIRSLCTSLADSEAALHSTGETLDKLRTLLVFWDALPKESSDRSALAAAREGLVAEANSGSVIRLVRSARRTAAGMRERLSPDFWALLTELDRRLSVTSGNAPSEGEALQQTEMALQTLAALAGLAQENMNRGAGWRFFDLGRRLERAINTCRLAYTLADEEATPDDLDLLLDLMDSQITYRARYIVGVALTPVRDMVLLDPMNTRSVAFQVNALHDHLEALPALVEDGMLEPPRRQVRMLAAAVETMTAIEAMAEVPIAWETMLLRLSNAIADRYFLQGANAVPTAKLAALA